MVKQMRGEYRVKNEELRDLYEQARELAGRFASVRFQHVRREQNKRADALCNEALDGERGPGAAAARVAKPAKKAAAPGGRGRRPRGGRRLPARRPPRRGPVAGPGPSRPRWSGSSSGASSKSTAPCGPGGPPERSAAWVEPPWVAAANLHFRMASGKCRSNRRHHPPSAAAASGSAACPGPRPDRPRECRPPSGPGNSSARMPSAMRSLRVVERRHQHAVVGDVEVGVAGRQPLALEHHRRRHRQRHHLQRPARPGRSCRAAAPGSPAAARNWRRPGLSSTTVTTVRGPTKRARSSTWPCVSSPAMPRSSHSTLRTPR